MFLILNLLLIISLLVLIISNTNIYNKALTCSFIIFITSIILVITLPSYISFSTVTTLDDIYNISFSLDIIQNIDGLSIVFIILSTFLNITCVLSANTIKYRKKLYFILLFLTQLILINLFAVNNVFSFYILFEIILVPIFLIIGIWGSRQEKITASLQFFIYTLFGSLFMLLSLIFIFLTIGTTNIWAIKTYEFPVLTERLIWLTFFLSFSVKIPMFPFHLWLPKAHVEAPTAGSVLLAGILLKLGGYGFIKFCILLFPSSTEFYRPFVLVIALLGIIYSSFTILRQIDLKRIVAYSSVSHMNFVILGCFSGNEIAVNGAILLMIAHGLVSGGLFLMVGYLYDRYKSRNIFYYRGLVSIMPLYTIIFFIFVLANLGFPPTLNFISELLILCGLFETNIFIAFFSGFSILFAGISGFWIYTRCFFGNFAVTQGNVFINYYYDLTRREFLSLLPLLILTFFGIYPEIFINVYSYSLNFFGV